MILTKYGKKEWGMALAAFLVVFVLCAATVFLRLLPPGVAGAITAFAALACFAACAFFRDPPRRIAADPSAIVSPADGVIKDVELIKSETLENDDLRRLFHDKDILRIGIFLSVFNRLNYMVSICYITYRTIRFTIGFCWVEVVELTTIDIDLCCSYCVV